MREDRTACKCDLLGRWGDPGCERCAADLVPESDHASDRLPTVLAKPVKERTQKDLHLAMIETCAHQPPVPTFPVQVPIPSER